MQIMFVQFVCWCVLGCMIVGIQIDFDVGMCYLQDYFVFLCMLCDILFVDCWLSIMGLFDWSSCIDIDQVNQFKGIVDEVVVQMYQGCCMIFDYVVYLLCVVWLQLLFCIGVIQGGEWDVLLYFVMNLWFCGYVVFLCNGQWLYM